MPVIRPELTEEREFYLSMAVQEKWNKRQLERQFNRALFEHTVLSPVKVSPAVTEIHPEAASLFKDAYTVEFLGLPQEHTENDLHRGLPFRQKSFDVFLDVNLIDYPHVSRCDSSVFVNQIGGGIRIHFICTDNRIVTHQNWVI
jgi:hypothetical protein